ncbi:WRKY DNA-binding protein 35 [Striga asiatica]|uniref:WRKY DNA-binding protein 35 n=1 Tax=Striga asiatica TaxID=4170 RepID=A0A5A7QCT1_STRAF|nr:WRKY DNA-binding protein 35 [Striga asiatica]
MQETDQPKSSGVETHASKKRKMGERVVVTVKLEESEKRQQKNEGPPFDCWSWRKYGQKPIKGSPYPRGYYRCSTSKGCSAKKQVERSKTDSSKLIITYTSSHNHPGPAPLPPENPKTEPNDIIIINSAPQLTHTHTIAPEEEQETQLEGSNHPGPVPLPPENPKTEPKEINIINSAPQLTETHIIAPEQEQETQLSPPDNVFVDQDKKNSFNDNLQTLGVLYEGEGDSKSITQFVKAEENDFFDELEELPTSSFFTSLMKNTLCEERVIVNPT